MTIADWEDDMAMRYDSPGCGRGANIVKVLEAMEERDEICQMCGGCGECWGQCTCQKEAGHEPIHRPERLSGD